MIFRDQWLPNGVCVRVEAHVSTEDALRMDWSGRRLPLLVRMPDGEMLNLNDATNEGIFLKTWPKDFENLDWLPPAMLALQANTDIGNAWLAETSRMIDETPNNEKRDWWRLWQSREDRSEGYLPFIRRLIEGWRPGPARASAHQQAS